ncbi:MAG: hypothetical protein JNM34_11810 [Chthonomonadaceae bacterium]|nr:hypothetical protein [Chthonomonadaceae bacterium]
MHFRYEFRWRGSGGVKIQNCLAQIWAPAVTYGSLALGSMDIGSIERPLNGPWSERRIGASSQVAFDSPMLRASLKLVDRTAALYDARSFNQDWAKGSSLLWIGQSDLPLSPGQTLEIEGEWSISSRNHPSPPPVNLSGQTTNFDPVSPAMSQLTLVPTPKELKLTGQTVRAHVESQRSTAGTDRLREALQRYWDVDEVNLPVSFSQQSLGLSAGYRIVVTTGGVQIEAASQAMADSALDTLARLSRPENGTLRIPCGTIKDWPTVSWRGAHLFYGSKTREIEDALVHKFLAPLRFNHLVVDCCRTNWPGVPNPAEKARKEDVATFFELARSASIEPVPLIQSLGHMDWLLTGSNAELAINSDLPYTLDVRRDRARKLIDSIWDEAYSCLKPKVVHFGLDEISMRGMPDDPTLPDRLWAVQVPRLMTWAKKKSITPMVWGDMMLALGEAPDATHAPSFEKASARRKLLSGGTIVTDWHYKPTDRPEEFTSLSLWKSQGMTPVASSWFRPANIRSHTLKAVEVGAGTLQTLWAGYSTDLKAIVTNPDQFAAFVLASEYSWTGRKTPIGKLEFVPLDVLRQQLFEPPRPVKAVSYKAIGEGRRRSMNGVPFVLFEPIVLKTPVLGPSGQADSVMLQINGDCKELILAVDCVAWQRDGDVVATVVVESDAGTEEHPVFYGGDVRSKDDVAGLVRSVRIEGLGLLKIRPKGRVKFVQLLPVSATAGVRLHGVSWR